MTPRPRLRRFAAAAAVVAATVLAASPAMAANTAGERLVDHDDNPATSPVREFAGTDRYHTAVLLAEAAAELAGTADTVIVASGETQVDAVAASGLASVLEAPIVLTRRDVLPAVTARFIVAHDPSRVLVLGGPAAVSDAVAERLGQLGASREVERIWGQDRFATAAAIADRIGSPAGNWCGSEGATVVLSAGSAIAEAVAAGPLTYAHGAPLLLTGTETLPDVTAEWMVEHQVERVIVVGGPDLVSGDVLDDALEAAGVTQARRIGGVDAADTAARLVDELHSARCVDHVSADTATVALARLTSPSDGITAAPVFGIGPNGGPAGVLLVQATMPPATLAWLKSTPRHDAVGQPTHLEIVAVGGDSAVPGAVMAQAITAASEAPAMRAFISAAQPGDTEFKITFSDDVDAQAATRASLLRINGIPRGDLVLTLTLPAEVTVRFTGDGKLQGGDKITVVSDVEIGAQGDRRPLIGADYTVPERHRDADNPPARPRLDIVAFTGATQFAVTVSEGELAAGSAVEADEITVTGPDGETIEVQAQLGEHHNELLEPRYVWVATLSAALQEGTRIEVAREATVSADGRFHNRREHRIVRGEAEFGIERVQVGAAMPTSSATAAITATTTSLDIAAVALVEARDDGAAAGANASMWRIDTWLDTNLDDGQVSVATDPKHSIVSVSIGDDVSVADLVSALNASAEVTAMFDVKLANAAARAARLEPITGLGSASEGKHDVARFSAGRSKIELRLLLDGPAASLAQNGSVLIEGLMNRYRADGDTTICTATGLRWDCFASPPGTPARADVAMRFVPGTAVVDIWVEASDPARLPKLRDIVDIAAETLEGWPAGTHNGRYRRVLVHNPNAPSPHGIDHAAWDGS